MVLPLSVLDHGDEPHDNVETEARSRSPAASIPSIPTQGRNKCCVTVEPGAGEGEEEVEERRKMEREEGEETSPSLQSCSASAT